MTFSQQNTQGYSDAELDGLNAEWEAIVEAEKLEAGTDGYYQREKAFSDEVAGRAVPTTKAVDLTFNND